jgi:hypothetical protein
MKSCLFSRRTREELAFRHSVRRPTKKRYMGLHAFFPEIPRLLSNPAVKLNCSTEPEVPSIVWRFLSKRDPRLFRDTRISFEMLPIAQHDAHVRFGTLCPFALQSSCRPARTTR